MSDNSSTKTDVEKGMRPKMQLEGFAEFSQFIASDDALSLYRRFDGVGSRNILYYQAELQYLEQQLEDLDSADLEVLQRESGEAEEKDLIDSAARAWESFQYQNEEGEERQRSRMTLVLRIREVMKEYEEAVLRRSQILALGRPNTATKDAFTKWFIHRNPLRGIGSHLVDKKSDLMTLKGDQDSDRISFLIEHYFGYYLKVQDNNIPKSWESMYYFPAKRVAWMVAILSTLISALLLLGAILSLYFIPATKMGKRLAVIGVFTVMFAASIAVLTNAKRGEIFAATAAYAAVLVVFLSAPTP